MCADSIVRDLYCVSNIRACETTCAESSARDLYCVVQLVKAFFLDGCAEQSSSEHSLVGVRGALSLASHCDQSNSLASQSNQSNRATAAMPDTSTAR